MSETAIRETLRKVIHPSYGMDVVTLNMVREIRLHDGEVELQLVMPCPACPASQATLARIEQAVRQLNGRYRLRMILLPEEWKLPWADWGPR